MVYFPVIEAYEAKVFKRMDFVTYCKVWAEDGHVRIAGDDKFHDCSDYGWFVIGTGRDGPSDWYWIIVKTATITGIVDYYHEGFVNHTCVCVKGNTWHINIKAHIIDNIDKCDMAKVCDM
ncbi:4249_t:CDS:2 [Gigaspora rosea]|nr:4249_t:CDS:2 [Gigaspora rosea]